MTLLRLMLLIFMTVPLLAAADELSVYIEKAPIDVTDKASLQRGAGLFMNYCSGCHSLQYMRYNRMAKDIGIVDASGKVDERLVKEDFMFDGAKPDDPIVSAMPLQKAKDWFGVPPPDLTLVARARGPDWLYTYLRSFYKDPSRPWGTNNLVYPGVAMPNVLLSLQGTLLPVYRNADKGNNGGQGKIIDHLILVENGIMSVPQFNRAVADLVTFLSYTAEPERQEREYIGLWVIVYLLILSILTYSLKEVYWKDVE